MKKMFVLGMGFMLILNMIGCGDISKLKEVKTVGLAGITFKKNFVNVNQNGEEDNSLDIFQLVPGKKVEFFPIDEEAKTFSAKAATNIIREEDNGDDFYDDDDDVDYYVDVWLHIN